MTCPRANLCAHKLNRDGSARLDGRGCCRDCGTLVKPRPRPFGRPNNAGCIALANYRYEGVYES